MRAVRIAPSILASDFAALGEAIRVAERGGADLIHVDVMDGHFVPNITIGPPVVKALKRVAHVPLDVHLMISEPDRYLEAFVDAGAAMISVHVEVLPHLQRTLAQIRHLGALAGAVLNPSTSVVTIEEVLDDLDFVLIMSVNPGFGGQVFIPRSEQKVRTLRQRLDGTGRHVPIEIDGGIDRSNIARVVDAGVDIVVAGSAVFGAPDPAAAVRQLRAAALRQDSDPS
jgi:ribulose-phosphate 3-epimerase